MLILYASKTSVSRVAPTPQVLLNSNPGATFFFPNTLYDFVHSAPQSKVALTADWSLNQFGATLRETLYGPTHNYTSPGGCTALNTCVYDPQAGVGLTDLEVRYNITDQLQFAVGADNIFNIRPDTVPFDVNAFGPGIGFPADGGDVVADPVGTAWDPNGGYYYGRITYNF